VGEMKAGGRRRAVGTRDRVMSYLLTTGEVRDASGMASTVLAEAIGYPGSSIAFAQLLSGMERSGLIEREVRGKRTYRITPTRAAATAARSGAAPRAGRPAPVAAGGARTAAKGAEDFDYDELARRLLMQVVQRLGTAPGPGDAPAEDTEAGEDAASDPSLARAVAGLEHKLASVRSKQRKLTEENARLREQLRAAQESLAQAEERASAAQAARLDSAEASLLERLLSSLHDQGTRQEEAGTG
jgi:hypothetical protein